MGKKVIKIKDCQADIARLQEQLWKAKEANDQGAEVDALLAIGSTAVQEMPDLAYSHFMLAEKVIRSSGQLSRLHEAIGGQGRVLRRNKQLAEAIARFEAAENAAGQAGNRAARVRWMLRRASAHRTCNELPEVDTIIEQAVDILCPHPRDEMSLVQYLGSVDFSNNEEVAALAELEGQIGLSFNRKHDEQATEDHYRSALYFAEMAGDLEAVSVWAGNVGRVCMRRGRYTQSIKFFEKALAAASKLGDGGSLLDAAMGLGDCFQRAHRHEQGGDHLCAIAKKLDALRPEANLLDRALQLYAEGLFAEKAVETAKKIEALVAGQPVRPEFLAHVQTVRKNMERLMGMSPRRTEGPPALDVFLPDYMVQAEKSGRADSALEAAFLVCDVHLAVAFGGQKQWMRLVGGDLLSQPGLDHRLISDTIRMLLDADEVDAAVELMQRFKAPAYCVPTLQRIQNTSLPSPEVREYLDAIRELCIRVEALAGPAQVDSLRAVHAVRRAGERMREVGEALRELDPYLLARMGIPVRSEELIDALPFGGGVGIVDFMVGRDSTVGVIFCRGREGVAATPLIATTFTAAEARQMADLYAEGNLPKQLGGAHTQALLKISKILHDHFFCMLAQELGRRGVNQLILVPDALTRNLPLHLSYACGKEFDIPGVDTKDAEFLCEVMPVEYAPCLQAVAASQSHLRPRAITRVDAFADPLGDLPGVRASMVEFKKRFEKPSAFRLACGKSATKAAVANALPDADVIIFGTHGTFQPGNLEKTHLVLNDESWSMADMLHMPELQKRALFVLIACEAGAIAATPDDRSAWGIPGALVSTGASAVLANLWPVEDITSNYLLERFLVHLAHPGYRPAAALFRAVRDLRRMGRDEALEYCRHHLDLMRKNKAEPRVLLGARTILEWIEDNDIDRPFAHPYFWGATAIFGSGWHLPQGAFVGPPQVLIENMLLQGEADDMLEKRKPLKALELAKKLIASSDGAARGIAYTIMAQGLIQSADLSSEQRNRQQAARWLRKAERIASNEADDNLRRRIQWVRTRMEDDYVAQKND